MLWYFSTKWKYIWNISTGGMTNGKNAGKCLYCADIWTSVSQRSRPRRVVPSWLCSPDCSTGGQTELGKSEAVLIKKNTDLFPKHSGEQIMAQQGIRRTKCRLQCCLSSWPNGHILEHQPNPLYKAYVSMCSWNFSSTSSGFLGCHMLQW